MNNNNSYFQALLSNKDNKNKTIPLSSAEHPTDNIPLSLIPEDEWSQFNITQYDHLCDEIKCLNDLHLYNVKMHAGLGSSLDRADLVSGRRLSAKGVDLSLDYRGKKRSIASIHLSVDEQRRKNKEYAKVTSVCLGNDETCDDLSKLLKSYPDSQLIIQERMMTIDAAGGLSSERLAPGGHGFLLFHLLKDIESYDDNSVIAIGNGEDVNSTVDSKMVAHLLAEKLCFVMITTTKTHKDKKGGQITLIKSETPRLSLFERAQAQECNQIDYFESLGLAPKHSPALFNTNIVLINVLAFKQALSHLSIDNMNNLDQFICPDVILNPKEQSGKVFTQLEGAMGSVVLNTAYFLDQNLPGKSLGIINIPESRRSDFFLPLKTRKDYDNLRVNYKFSDKDLKYKIKKDEK